MSKSNELTKAIAGLDILSPPKQYIAKILHAICDGMGYRFGSVIEVGNNGTGQMICLYNLPEDYADLASNLEAPLLSSPSGEAVATGRTVVLHNPLSDPRMAPWSELLRPQNIKTMVWVPLLSGDHAFGVYVLYDNKIREVSASEVVKLKQIATIISVGIVSNHNLDQLKRKTRELEHEIMRRKRLEEALQKSYDELEMRVEKRTAELRKVNRRLNLEIEDRKQVEKALQKSEKDKTNILQTMSELVMYVDTDMKILWANRAACESVGLTAGKLVGSYCYKEWFQRAEPCPFCPGKKIFETGQPAEGETYSPDGRVWHFRGYPAQDENGNIVGIVEVIDDITKRKQAEKEQQKLLVQFQQAQKMEAVGTLAGGLAHDINNLLMGIQGYVSLMLLHTDPHDAYFEYLKTIEASIAGGANLTRQLLGFARGGKYDVKPTDLNVLIRKNSQMFGRTKKEIKIHSKCQEDLQPVNVDRSQIDQVLLNLYVNAWQAMPDGGNLYIETSNVVLDKNATKPFNGKPGNYVKVSVSDTGVGMDKTILQRIFDPFFTTKKLERGTGLGLASVYGIIKHHGGIINVYSEKGYGTTFNIYLPASEKEVAEEEKKSEDILLTGTETILLVDDESLILEVGQEILRQMGYKVYSTASGKEAVEMYRKHKEKIDLVILDMIMPDMGGGEVYNRMKEINPEVRCLLSSGYSIDGQASEILAQGCNGFIQKPFTIEALSRKIREILK